MDVLEKARELAQAIAEDERCKRFQAAKLANDSDKELQDIIGEFNLKRLQLSNEFDKPVEQQSKEKMERLQNELKELYAKAMANKSMIEYNKAKAELDKLLAHINSIIQMSVTGEVGEGGCAGNCASCAGCR